MTMSSDRLNTETFYKLSTIFSLLAGVIFMLGFVGWLFNVSSLTDVDSGWSPIKPICSISGMLLVFSNLLIVRRRSLNWLNLCLAIVPLFMAFISIYKNLTNAPSAIGDEFLWRNDFHPIINHPGRISFSSGILSLVTSLGLLFGLKNKKSVKRSQYCSLLVIYYCLFLLLGHLLQADAMTSSKGLFHGSIHSLVGLFLLNLAILSRTPEFGSTP